MLLRAVDSICPSRAIWWSGLSSHPGFTTPFKYEWEPITADGSNDLHIKCLQVSFVINRTINHNWTCLEAALGLLAYNKAEKYLIKPSITNALMEISNSLPSLFPAYTPFYFNLSACSVLVTGLTKLWASSVFEWKSWHFHRCITVQVIISVYFSSTSIRVRMLVCTAARLEDCPKYLLLHPPGFNDIN